MAKYLENVIRTILYIWQLPQNVAGLLLLLYFRKVQLLSVYNGRRFYVTPKMRGGVSLGQYIFLSPSAGKVEQICRHEYGHSLQSLYLGPLYLIVIGLPSIMHAAVCRSGNYYHFYTEQWANRLAGIPEYTGEK